jgi:hypothetical protein
LFIHCTHKKRVVVRIANVVDEAHLLSASLDRKYPKVEFLTDTVCPEARGAFQ